MRGSGGSCDGGRGNVPRENLEEAMETLESSEMAVRGRDMGVVTLAGDRGIAGLEGRFVSKHVSVPCRIGDFGTLGSPIKHGGSRSTVDTCSIGLT